MHAKNIQNWFNTLDTLNYGFIPFLPSSRLLVAGSRLGSQGIGTGGWPPLSYVDLKEL